MDLDTGSPTNTTGSGGNLAAELHLKADLGDGAIERAMSKRDDLRVAALSNYAIQKAQNDTSPRIGARKFPHSPDKTTSTTASDTVVGEPPLRRQNSASFSTGVPVPRASRSRSPSKRPASAVLEGYEEVIGRKSLDRVSEARQSISEPCSGLDFLLQACDILEPGATEESSKHRPNPKARRSLAAAAESQPSRSVPVRIRRPCRYSNEEEYSAIESSEDDEYRPGSRGRNSRRNSRATGAVAPSSEGRPSTSTHGSNGRWERGMVTGPCTNPDCEHPYDSPQWRKGPAECPILCNACGTRWLRNGSLKPLVPRRGIRYNKPKPRAPKAAKPAAQKTAYLNEDDDHMEEEDREYFAPAQPIAQPQQQQQPQEQQQQHQAPIAIASLANANEALVKAMAAIQGIQNLPQFLPVNGQQADPEALQRQLAAMTAAAQAAQHAFAAVSQSNIHIPQQQQQQSVQQQSVQQQSVQQQSVQQQSVQHAALHSVLPSSQQSVQAQTISPVKNMHPSRPVFEITAVAGPPQGPMFYPASDSSMQVDK